jgi:hypothetical protein
MCVDEEPNNTLKLSLRSIGIYHANGAIIFACCAKYCSTERSKKNNIQGGAMNGGQLTQS